MTASPIQVLVIDDNEGDADLVRIGLQDAEEGAFLVDSAPTLAAGAKRLAKGGVDVVLLDLGLPDSVGFEGLQRLRKDYPSVPVLVMTGQRDGEVGKNAIREGARDYMIKGFHSGPALAKRLRGAIEWQRVEGELKRTTAHLTGRSQAK